MRLIDADALTIAIHEDWDDVLEWDADGVETANEIERTIWEQPTVDAVSVVMCKDCRHYRFYDGTFGKGWICFECNIARHGDDYCSRGERRSE